MRWNARSPSSGATSRPTVSTPASTHNCAMPLPIAPSPTTPTFLISRATAAILLSGGLDELDRALKLLVGNPDVRVPPDREREDSCLLDRRRSVQVGDERARPE